MGKVDEETKWCGRERVVRAREKGKDVVRKDFERVGLTDK